ncbi:hypothetical protein GOC43_25830 [Sinorhizobium meliloti]|nr:hypothetical protein [Sinorhizobium meliloti]
MSKPRSYQKSKDELIEALHEQVGFLRASCTLYDGGAVSEAARIATSIYILVNDGSSQSLLTLLGLRKQIEFVSFASEPVPGNLLAEEPLVMLHIGPDGFGYHPVLDQGPIVPRRMKFSHWWEREIAFNTPGGQKLDRKRLVYAMRNQDGGGHIDPRLTDDAYVTFSRQARWTGTTSCGKETLPHPRPHHASMRHIGFEFLKSIEDSQVL